MILDIQKTNALQQSFITHVMTYRRKSFFLYNITWHISCHLMSSTSLFNVLAFSGFFSGAILAAPLEPFICLRRKWPCVDREVVTICPIHFQAG